MFSFQILSYTVALWLFSLFNTFSYSIYVIYSIPNTFSSLYFQSLFSMLSPILSSILLLTPILSPCSHFPQYFLLSLTSPSTFSSSSWQCLIISNFLTAWSAFPSSTFHRLFPLVLFKTFSNYNFFLLSFFDAYYIKKPVKKNLLREIFYRILLTPSNLLWSPLFT